MILTNLNSRLQFRHNDEVYGSRTEALRKFFDLCASRPEGQSLLAEPTIMLYGDEKVDASGNTYVDKENPHVILTIGAKDNNTNYPLLNRYCVIDIDHVWGDIKEHYEEFQKAVESLTTIALSSNTLNLYAEKGEDGTYISGDVKTAEYFVFDGQNGKKSYNNLMETRWGLFAYAHLDYDVEKESFTFTVSNHDGSYSETTVKMPNNYVIKGEYNTAKESIILTMKEGEPVEIDCSYLLNEWTVDNGTKTPVILHREEVYDNDFSHVKPYQDVLSADIRIKDEIINNDGEYEVDEKTTNILKRTLDGRALYVDGVASNIIYYSGGTAANVQDALDNLHKTRLSSDSNNIIVSRLDGFFASSKLEYVSSDNKLIFRVSGLDSDGKISEKKTEIKLNTVQFFDNVWYDATTEELVIAWKDDEGETQFSRIPIGQMLEEWEPINEGHNVTIVRQRNVQGKDKVSADVRIVKSTPTSYRNNILEDREHQLYVRGEADNIKYDGTSGSTETVKSKLDDLRRDLLDEVERSANEDIKHDKLIGSGFTTDPHDNVTYKFETLNTKIDEEIARSTREDERLEQKLDNEITRSTQKDQENNAAITQEIADRIADVNAEESRAISAETALSYKIDTDVLAEKNRASSAETALQTAINNEVTRATNAENTLTTNLNNEITRARAAEENISDDLAAEVARARAKEDELDAKIDDATLTVGETATAKMQISSNNVITTDVKLNTSNTILLADNGIKANVDLTYNGGTNTLTFTKTTPNGDSITNIALNAGSIIDSMVYDEVNKELVIKYHTSSSATEQETRVNVSDLFNEWTPVTNHQGAVQLTKTTVGEGANKHDELYAEVVISSQSSNILQNVGGALLVDASQITTDLSNYYKKSETSGKTEIATALTNKLDVSAYTPTDLSNYYTKSETSGKTEIETALSGKVNSSDVVTAITPSNSASTAPVSVSVVAENELLAANALNYLSANKLDTSAYTPADLSNYYTKSETSGKTEIETALSDKVNSSDVVTAITPSNSASTAPVSVSVVAKNELVFTTALNDLHTNKLDVSAYTPADLSNYYTKSETSGKTEIETALSGKVNSSDVVTAITPSNSASTAPVSVSVVAENELVLTTALNDLNTKVNSSDVVTAITPSNSASTAPVSVNVVAKNEFVIANALNDLSVNKLDASAYTPTDLSNYYTKSETSGKTEIETALSGKVNSSDVVTAITPSNSASTAPVSVNVVAENELVLTTALNDLNTKVNSSDVVTAITPSNSASTAPVSVSVVAKNEFVIANALNDLKLELSDLIMRINNIELGLSGNG